MRRYCKLMIMDFKMIKQFLLVGVLIGSQGCVGATLGQYFDKPYFSSSPAQMSQVDRELFDQALDLQKNNRIQPVIKVWNQFLEKHPRSFEAHNNLGLVYFEDDQIDASIAELETAMSLEPTEPKIKKNLVRVLKFKAILYKEARDFNRAVDTLKRSQEIASPEQKEKIGFRIEEYEDPAYEQAKRIDTLEAYEGFLKRYPNSSKNSDEARMKIEGLKPGNTVFQENSISPEASSEAPLAQAGDEGMDVENFFLESPVIEGGSKESMAEEPPTGKDFTEENIENVEMAEETPPNIENLDNGFIPVRPLEIPRSAEQEIEITTDPELDISSQSPQTVSPVSEDVSEVDMAPQKKVKVVTRKSPLRVREDPDLDSRILASVPKGSLLPFIEEENGWYKIEFSDGQMGWVSKKYSQLVE